jgi:hypothetical protein
MAGGILFVFVLGSHGMVGFSATMGEGSASDDLLASDRASVDAV